MQDKRIQFLYDTLDFILSLLRLIAVTRFRKTCKIDRKKEHCIVMGNGPSLRNSLKENKDVLGHYDLIAVNDMALTPEFITYKPVTYVLCDPAYWFAAGTSESTCKEVRDLYRHLVKQVDWEMQLYIPWMAKKVTEIADILSQNTHIHLCYYNKTKVEGFRKFQYMILKRQWGMFRAETVINAALMLALYSGYGKIYLMGTETDWLRNIWVDEQNRLRLNDTHFYGASDRIISTKMHEQCISSYHVFKTYTEIEKYSKHCRITIYNITPHSLIDAFEKANKIE
jgi:hypothetical protein